MAPRRRHDVALGAADIRHDGRRPEARGELAEDRHVLRDRSRQHDEVCVGNRVEAVCGGIDGPERQGLARHLTTVDAGHVHLCPSGARRQPHRAADEADTDERHPRERRVSPLRPIPVVHRPLPA